MLHHLLENGVTKKQKPLDPFSFQNIRDYFVIILLFLASFALHIFPFAEHRLHSAAKMFDDF